MAKGVYSLINQPTVGLCKKKKKAFCRACIHIPKKFSIPLPRSLARLQLSERLVGRAFGEALAIGAYIEMEPIEQAVLERAILASSNIRGRAVH
jgi:hypothetical protein